MQDERQIQLSEAMNVLGALWGLDRPVTPRELGKALELNPKNPARPIQDWLEGRRRPNEATLVAIEMMRLGALPPRGLREVLEPRKRKRRSDAKC
jgi:hypothetical protein